jgi:GGDEF domain-containing protein
VNLDFDNREISQASSDEDHDFTLKTIANKTPFIYGDTNALEAYYIIIQNSTTNIIPVVDQDLRVIGQIQRIRYIENIYFGRFGYGIYLNAKKKVKDIMEQPDIIFDANTKAEKVALKINNREEFRKHDDIIVVEDNKYYGTVKVHDLMELLTKRMLQLARDLNPLTGLPGNWALRKYIEERIVRGDSFDVIYLDINNFKPYNDHYGFLLGDKVIYIIGEILKRVKTKFNNVKPFHLGGDDFIIVAPYEEGEKISKLVIDKFETFLPKLHGKDFEAGFYKSIDRDGKVKSFPLLSISCAIVSVKENSIKNFAHLASVAAEVKQAAKSLAKSSAKSVIFANRRKNIT